MKGKLTPPNIPKESVKLKAIALFSVGNYSKVAKLKTLKSI